MKTSESQKFQIKFIKGKTTLIPSFPKKFKKKLKKIPYQEV